MLICFMAASKYLCGIYNMNNNNKQAEAAAASSSHHHLI